MAHVLIGFYRSLTEAETIVHDLVEQGFARPCITLATPHATVPAPEHLGLQTWSTLEGAEGLRRRFLDLGVPDGEVSTYIEAVRQGGTLVVVQASAEQAERGLDILHGQRPGDRQGGRPLGSGPLCVKLHPLELMARQSRTQAGLEPWFPAATDFPIAGPASRSNRSQDR
jgi:hypothetical protein